MSVYQIELQSMKTINVTKKTILAEDVKLVKTFIDRLTGLLNPKNPRALIFKTRFGIHTFFLKEPIDVLVLNNQNQVIKIKPSLKPNHFFFWNPKYNTIIELPNNSVSRSKTQIKDQIELVSS